jgi:hypothetical protein
MKKLFADVLIFAVLVMLAGCATDYTSSRTPLSTAAVKGDINTVKDLLAKGANACEKEKAGITRMTAYNWAFLGESTRGTNTCRNETYRILMENAYETFNKGGQCEFLFYFAIIGGCDDIVKKLLEKGQDPNERYGNLTALSEAAHYGQLETAKILINKGADLDSAIYGLKKLASDFPNDRLANEANLGIELLNGFKSKQVDPKTNVATGLTKEDLTTIMQAAVEGASKSQKKETKSETVKTDIDKPAFGTADKIMGDNDLAVIIGIEGYSNLPKSDYSYDDARIVKNYVKALGFKERNIELITDEKATLSGIAKTIEVWLKNKAKEDSRVFVYYSGHGAPDPATGEAYLIPFDGDPNYLSVTGYPLKKLYSKLGQLQVKEVMVILDACFSGAGGRSVLAKGARPLVMVAETASLSSNVAVLTATQGSQISTSSPEKGHGIFTYYFLKAIKDGKRNLAEIYEYIKPQVEDEAKQINVQQSPSLNPGIEKVKGRFSLRN